MGALGHLKRELLSTIVEITTVARTHFVPGDSLSDLPALSHLSLSATPCERNYDCVHFLETEGHTATKQKTQDSRQGSPTAAKVLHLALPLLICFEESQLSLGCSS